MTRASIRVTPMRLLERFAHDVRYAARFLRRSPRFSLTAIAVLALGIGANTAVFSVAKDVLLRPLPYPEPDRLVQYIGRTRSGKIALASVPRFIWWSGAISADESITAYYGGGPGVTLIDGDRREHIPAMYASSQYFHVFRAPLLFGRGYRGGEDQPQGPRVAVISHAFAARRFGAHRNPVGQLLPLGDGSYEIVGVLGPSFQSQPHADIWLPLQAPRVSFNHTAYLTVVARLRAGTTVSAANRQAYESTPAFRKMFPDTMAPYEDFGAESLEHMLAGDSRPALQMLSGAVVCVLLIACANAANLFVSRAARRKGDIATRSALGAGRGRLIRQLFAECILLALAGGATGFVLGHVGIRALLTAIPGAIANGATARADTPVLTFTLAVSILTAVAFGLLPVLRASRVDLSAALKDNAAESTTGTGERRRQSLLVVAEMTMAIVLLVGAGLLIRTFLELRNVDRGFRSTGVLTFEMPLNTPAFQTGPAVNELVRAATSRFESVAGVRNVAAAYTLPLEPAISLPFTLMNRPLNAAPYHGTGHFRSVSAEYFRVLGIPLMRGQMFSDRDVESGQRVVLINRTMARRFWQDQDPIGEKVVIGKSADREFDEQPRFIIGIVGDVKDAGTDARTEPMMYVPIGQTGDRMIARSNRFFTLKWLVRTDDDGASVRGAIEHELRGASDGLPIARVRRIEDVVRAATAQLEFATVLLSVFAAAALLLSAVGLYGLMAYSVEQRRQEIGIRLALGAEPSMLRNMVLAEGGQLAATGVALGLGGAYAAARALGSVIFGIATWDATVFAIVAALLAVVSMVAAYLPAQDATRVDPLVALRRS